MATIVKYAFATGEVISIEVEDEVAAVVLTDRIKECSANRKARRHKAPLDEFMFEDRSFFGDENTPETLLIRKEDNEALFRQLESISEVHKKRLLMYLDGMTYEEIAAREKVSITAVYYSIDIVRKKIRAFFWWTLITEYRFAGYIPDIKSASADARWMIRLQFWLAFFIAGKELQICLGIHEPKRIRYFNLV